MWELSHQHQVCLNHPHPDLGLGTKGQAQLTERNSQTHPEEGKKGKPPWEYLHVFLNKPCTALGLLNIFTQLKCVCWE